MGLCNTNVRREQLTGLTTNALKTYCIQYVKLWLASRFLRLVGKLFFKQKILHIGETGYLNV